VRRPSSGGAGQVECRLLESLPTMRRDLVSRREDNAAGFDDALRYFDAIAALVSGPTGPAVGSKPSGLYEAASRRFTSVLAQNGYTDGPALADSNFCLSLVDNIQEAQSPWPMRQEAAVEVSAPKEKSFLDGIASIFRKAEPTKVPVGPLPITGLSSCKTATRCLNLLSNRLKRTLLYGADEDVQSFGDALVQGRPSFGSLTPLDHASTRMVYIH
jgi:hypothetical protein